MDSSGLGVLVEALRAAQASGRRLRVATVRPMHLKLFELTGISALLGLGDGHGSASEG